MLNRISRAFSDHPQSVGETYGEHAAFASSFGLQMVLCGIACLVHAVFPFLFVRTGSTCIRELHARISNGPRALPQKAPQGAVSTSRS